MPLHSFCSSVKYIGRSKELSLVLPSYVHPRALLSVSLPRPPSTACAPFLFANYITPQSVLVLFSALQSGALHYFFLPFYSMMMTSACPLLACKTSPANPPTQFNGLVIFLIHPQMQRTSSLFIYQFTGMQSKSLEVNPNHKEEPRKWNQW